MAFEIWRGKIDSHGRSIQGGPRFRTTITQFRLNGVMMKFDGGDAFSLDNGDELIAIGKRHGTRSAKAFAVYKLSTQSIRHASPINKIIAALWCWLLAGMFIKISFDKTIINVMWLPSLCLCFAGAAVGYFVLRIYLAQASLIKELRSLGYEFFLE